MKGKSTRARLICSVSHLATVLLLIHVLGQLHACPASGAEARSDPYDVLYDVIMTRYGPDGEAYGAHESAPAIFSGSEFPFDDRTYSRLNTALDAFATLSQTEIEAYSDIQRAWLQRHLWHVFDATAPYIVEITDRVTGKPRQDLRNKSHMHRREAMRPKIASLIQRLALPKARILALPDTKAATLKSGVFSPRHDPSRPFEPFLPPDVYAEETSWVCIGDKYEPPAPFHQDKLKFRSAFLSFMRLPGGRGETLEYIVNDTQERGNVKHFPAGTQFAFFEQAFLISDKGEMVFSPLVVSISLRAYLDVERKFSRVSRVPTQSLAEFVAQPRQLIQGNAVMKPLGQRDLRFDAGDVSGLGEAIDPFERRNEPLTRGRGPMLRRPRLELCMTCHNDRGADGVAGGGGLFGAKESSPEEIVKEALSQKRDHYTWKALIELWQADAAAADEQSDIQTERSEPPSTKRELKVASDPYDVLYDVLMTRYQPDGTSYGQDETAPVILRSTRFPFDDQTYEKLNAALNEFAALPQAKVEDYSDIKRALLQSHLWKVYDATHPAYRNDWIENGRPVEHWGSHPRRRAAVRPKIASLIHRLALTKSQIQALPDTRLATVMTGAFAKHHDSDDLLKPFLPGNLFAKDSSWIALGQTDDPIPTDMHSTKFKWRAAFMSFMRAPGGRENSLECVKKYNRRQELPVGTQVALVEQAFLISDEGEIVLSPLTVGISLRAYVGLATRERDGRTIAKQCLAEFVMQPRQLMQGNAVMKALSPEEFRYEAGGSNTPEGEDPARYPRLQNCRRCHGGARTLGLRTAIPERLEASTPTAIIDAILTQKRNHQTWLKLHEVLRMTSRTGDGTQVSVTD